MKTLVPSLLLAFASVPPIAAQDATGSAAARASYLRSEGARQVWMDFDQDGDRDLYTLRPDRADVLLRNLGEGCFADATLESGLSGNASSAAMTADFDHDGRADLWLLDAETTELRLFQGADGGAFHDVTASVGLLELRGVERLGSVDFDQDGWADLWLEAAGGQPWLFRNAAGVFERVELGLPAVSLRETVSSMPRTDVVTAAEPTDRVASRPLDEASGPEPATPDDTAPTGPSVRRAPPEAIRSPLTAPAGGLEATPILAGGGCATSLRDAAFPMSCLRASGVATLGRLYPLTEELNVTGGNVNIGTSLASSFDLNVVGDTKASGQFGPTNGYLGAQGTSGYDGVLSASWAGFEIGVAGISTGVTTTDNYGVMGHATHAGVRGEYASAPSTDYAELGTPGYGIEANGTLGAARFLNDVLLENSAGDATVRIENGTTAGSAMHIYDGSGNTMILLTDLSPFHGALGGTMVLSNTAGQRTVFLDGDAVDGALIAANNDANFRTVEIRSDNSGAGTMSLTDGAGSPGIMLDGGAVSGGEITVRTSGGGVGVRIDGDSGGDGLVQVNNDNGLPGLELDGGHANNAGRIQVLGTGNFLGCGVHGTDASGTGGEFVARSSQGVTTVELDGQNGATGELVVRETDASYAMRMVGCTLSLYNSSGTVTQTYDRCTGTKSGVVRTSSYGDRLLYAVESPEVWFEDFGSAQLADGLAVVMLDPMFLEAVEVDEGENAMKVFVTPTSPNQGLWVQKGADHFTVRASADESNEATFDWRVVVKRKGAHSIRMESLDELNERQRRHHGELDAPD